MAMGEGFSYVSVEFTAFVGREGIDRRVILRELDFDDTHDTGSVENIVKGMERAGWMIKRVEIHTDSDSFFVPTLTAETFAAVFDALFESPENAGQIIAYGELFGWMAENFEMTRYGRKYEDGYYGVYDTLTDFAQEFAENDEEFSGILSSPYISVDWEATADNLLNDFSDFEYGYEIYIFANH